MTIELAQTLSIVFFTISGISFLIAVALFFVFKIPKMIADATGVTAKKAIESIQEENARTGKVARANLRGTSGESGKISKATRFQRPETAVLSRDAGDVRIASPEEVAQQESLQGTTKLPSTSFAVEYGMQESANVSMQQVPSNGAAFSAETSVLNQSPDFGETSVLTQQANFGETSVLGQPANFGETSVLGQPMNAAPVEVFLFHVDVEISFAESKEIID